MSDKGRLCNICGRWIPEADDLVILRDGDGVAHLRCAWDSIADRPTDAEWDHLPAAERDRLDPGSAE